jgi:hypothetical protein
MIKMSQIFIVFLCSLILLSGCTNFESRLVQSDNKVLPFKSETPVILKSNELYSIMKRANFTDNEILTYGAEVRNSIATYGGVQVKRAGRVFCIIASYNEAIYVTSSEGQSFIMKL